MRVCMRVGVYTYFILLHTVKWCPVLLCITNNSIKQ